MSMAKRVEELEKRLGAGRERCIWWIVFVDPKKGELADDSVCGYTSGGKRWGRKDGESVQQLRERVEAEVEYNEWGAAFAIECYPVDTAAPRA